MIAGRTDERSDHVAVTVAKRDDFIALEVLVAVISEVVAAFFRSRARSVTVNDADIELVGFMQGSHGSGKHRVDDALRLKEAQRPMQS